MEIKQDGVCLRTILNRPVGKDLSQELTKCIRVWGRAACLDWKSEKSLLVRSLSQDLNDKVAAQLNIEIQCSSSLTEHLEVKCIGYFPFLYAQSLALKSLLL